MIKISLTLFNIYQKINKNSILNGVKIINLSNPSYLDVFEKSDG
jgi:hypothetical protein